MFRYDAPCHVFACQRLPDGPHSVQRLPDGHTLVSLADRDKRIRAVLPPMAGVQSLSNIAVVPGGKTDGK